MAADKPIAISYEGAIALGLKRYFTGQPCDRAGHVYFRNLKRHCIKCKNELEKARVSQGPAREKLIQYREKNKEGLRAYGRAKYRKNPEPYKHRASNWKILNPEAARLSAIKRSAKWRANNREYTHVARRIKRARKLENGGSHTVQDVADIFKSQRGKCAYCKKKVTMLNKHVDHIIAISKGGTNDRRNLQILCQRCNLRKHAKDPIDYARSQGMLL